jgi:single-stranded-DNA-specific exonuclease
MNLRRRALPDGKPLPGMHPVLDRVYRARGISAQEQLDHSLRRLLPVSGLHGVQAAAALLADAVTAGRRILLVGDFDADGATSVAVAVRALRAMGAHDPLYLVPNRFEDGYGLSPPLVAEAARLAADVLVTVDNGISSIEGVAAARKRHMQVVVTDHHLPGEQLPDADVIVNPNLRDCAFPSKWLAGVGVIFYTMVALSRELERRGWFGAHRQLPSLAGLLDLVALGTVADLVHLDQNNRILIEQGLRRIRAGKACPGLVALLELGGRDPRHVGALDLGFAAGPRLNAAGRLEDISVGIECLLTDDPARAASLAAELDALNRQRRELEDDMQRQAVTRVEAQLDLGASLPACLCLHDAGWHEGIVGLLASRIKDRYHRPVFAFAHTGEVDLKGSGRSIPGLHLRDLLARIDAEEPGLIKRFGGHAAAAGLTLGREDLSRFQARAVALACEQLDTHALSAECLTDGPLTAADMTLGLAADIERGGPWGQGLPEPLFANAFEVLERRPVGGGAHLRLSLRLCEASRRTPVLEAIAFQAQARGWDQPATKVEVAYHLGVNRWQGRERLQLLVRELRPCE